MYGENAKSDDRRTWQEWLVGSIENEIFTASLLIFKLLLEFKKNIFLPRKILGIMNEGEIEAAKVYFDRLLRQQENVYFEELEFERNFLWLVKMLEINGKRRAMVLRLLGVHYSALQPTTVSEILNLANELEKGLISMGLVLQTLGSPLAKHFFELENEARSNYHFRRT